ncbi:MAG: hypothetical protein GPOALKHO_001475 [Sodalis sp.]|nr:MAG: hypothetical protein GPOALKHO_001475 [Sodalis sp.]
MAAVTINGHADARIIALYPHGSSRLLLQELVTERNVMIERRAHSYNSCCAKSLEDAKRLPFANPTAPVAMVGQKRENADLLTDIGAFDNALLPLLQRPHQR